GGFLGSIRGYSVPRVVRDDYLASCILEPQMDTVGDSEASKAIALKAIRGVFIERDARVVQELFAPDYIQHNPTIPSGRDAISALVGSLPEGFRYEPGMVVQKATSS